MPPNTHDPNNAPCCLCPSLCIFVPPSSSYLASPTMPLKVLNLPQHEEDADASPW